jgi:hypothetical protein
MLTKNLGHIKFLKFQGQLGIDFKESQWDSLKSDTSLKGDLVHKAGVQMHHLW